MRRQRLGFTLVELLVVITIISMLMALLMPAVQGAREAGRRASCMNNQYQLGRAMLNFESSHERFPGYREHVAGWPSNPYSELNVSWVVMVFPYMEQNELSNRWSSQTDPTTEADPIYMTRPCAMLEFLQCPSGPTEGARKGNPHLGYVVNTGIPNTAAYATGVGGAGITETVAYGVFHDHALYRDSAGATISNSIATSWGGQPLDVGLDYLSSNDGSSNTLMLSENLQATTWTHHEDYDTVGEWRSRPLEVSWEAELGMVWWPRDDSIVDISTGVGGVVYVPADLTPLPINANKDKTTDPIVSPIVVNGKIPAIAPATAANANTALAYARPSSRHPGGVVATFCDGHNQFLSESIDYHVYCHLMTPNSKKAKILGILDGGSY